MNLNALVEALTEMRRELNGARADLARATGAQTHTGITADSRETICGIPREPAFLAVPASEGVTCVACLQGVGRLYGENAFRNLKDAIANRERAERAEADLARVTAELAEANGALQALEVRMFDTVTTVESERDAARAQVCELQKVARAAVAVRNGTLGAVRGLDRAVLALPPSMLEEPSDG